MNVLHLKGGDFKIMFVKSKREEVLGFGRRSIWGRPRENHNVRDSDRESPCLIPCTSSQVTSRTISTVKEDFNRHEGILQISLLYSPFPPPRSFLDSLGTFLPTGYSSNSNQLPKRVT